MLTKLILPALLTSLLGGCLGTGCAEMKAVEGVSMMFEKAVPVLLEKAIVTSSTVSASGEIRDPEYTMMGLWVTGLMANIGVRGVNVSGALTGSGSGTDKPLSAETVEWLREHNPPLLDELVRRGLAVIEKANP